MRRKRAEDPSYGQASSRNGYEEEYEEDYEVSQLTLKALIVIVVGIGLALFFVWLYFKFFHEPEKEESVI